MKAIYFDMDGTIANLYGQNDWLDCRKLMGGDALCLYTKQLQVEKSIE